MTIKIKPFNTRSVLAVLGVTGLMLSSVSASACLVDYQVENDWGSGAQISLTFTTDVPLNGYALTWSLGQNEVLQHGWGATFESQSVQVSAQASPNSWEGELAANQSKTLGFIVAKDGSSAVAQPESFLLEGKLCNADAGSPTDPSDPPTPVEAITASLAAQHMGTGFNIGQTFESDQHPRTFESVKAKIDAYYAKGYRNVRIPITWTEAIGGSMLVHDAFTGELNTKHSRLQVIHQIVDYALSLEGLYVVINAHHEKRLKDTDNWQALETLWSGIAQEFKHYDYRLLYEILNEPHKSTGDMPAMANSMVRLMTSKAYDQIRAADEKRLIVIGGNRWFGAHELAETWPNIDDVGGGADDYVMATFHHYNPWSFHGNYQGDYSDAWTESHISNPMDAALNWSASVAHDMPIYIGEWGTGWGSRYSTMQCNNIRHWYQLFDQQYASPKGLPTSVWDDGGWFKIFDHATNQYDNNLADCILGQCEWSGDLSRFNAGCL